MVELERTGAFERSAIVMMTSAGTGWLSDFSVDAVEFLTGGDCALVAMQYSYLPSAVSYLSDRDSPIESSMLLIQAIEERLARLDDDARPKFFVSGESLGGYGIAESFDHIADLLARCDGAVFSGVPGFTGMHRALTVHRDAGSPHRLPLVDGGRHVRFVATPEHLDHDFRGEDYPEPWATPRVVFAQHASDPIVYWHPRIFYRRPEWLSEPGSRGVPAPAAQHLDVFEGMRWVPFITGWQVGLDQLTSLDVPGGHGHNYHREMLSYWAAVLDDVVAFEVTEEFLDAAEAWIYDDHIDR
ncbi:alpha/beta-hydrolase family protein [Corynebacterium yudongzhengii]|uniref:alpha/beta-hydrolase family protein n=1 Tax=Corynebacterium yudongzhengii TaxID=2080740 RepID=UPI001F1CD8E1|nr:alpha/beta-hydrolase family protein [Corynebacterium yudongzhengii]